MASAWGDSWGSAWGDSWGAVAVVPVLLPPGIPTNLNAAPGDSQVTLTWNASGGATSYNLYRSLTSGGEVLIQSGITATTFVDTGLSNGTKYFYQVSAVNANGESGRSNEAIATPFLPMGGTVGGGGESLVPSYHQLFPPVIRRPQWPELEKEKRKKREKKKRKLRPVLVELKPEETQPIRVSDDDFFGLLLITNFDFGEAEMLVDAGVIRL